MLIWLSRSCGQPHGIAWPRNPDSVLQKTVKGLAKIWGYVDGRA
jgi:hypothetical protein